MMASTNRPFSKQAIFFLFLVGGYGFFYIFQLNSRNTSYNKPSARLIEVYQNQINERRGWMSLISSSDEKLEWGFLYNNLAPEVYCSEKLKVGTTDDGGKWMLSPFNLPNGCTIFALGINNAISFESHIQKLSNQRCQIISVDSGQQNNETIEAMRAIRGTVVKAMIGNQDTENTRTMDSILKEHGVNEVEILKIDIEGAEFATMPTFLDKYTISQIMIEVHGNAQKTFELLKWFASKGYLLYHYEINGRHHNLCEYAFIHESKLERYGATLLAKYL